MRKNSKIMIATGAAGVMLLGLTACGPTAVEDDPSDNTSPGVEQPATPVEPAPGNNVDEPTDGATDMPGLPDDETTTAP